MIVVVFGPQTIQAVGGIRKEIESLLDSKHGPCDLLVDVTRAEVPGELASQAALLAVQEVPFRRLAVFGGKPGMLQHVHQLLAEGGGNERLKVFRSEALAREWLEQASHPMRTKLKHQTERLRPDKD